MDTRDAALARPDNFRDDDALDDESGDGSLLALFAIVLRRRALVLGTLFLAIALVIPYLAMISLSYTSSFSFAGDSPRQPAASNLAAQIGLNLGSVDPLNTPYFYPEFVKSRPFLRGVAAARYPTAPGDSIGRDLVEIFGITEGPPHVRLDEAAAKLGDAVGVSVATRTGVVSVYVTNEDPRLAQAIAQEILDQIHEFNVGRRQGRAGSERKFVEQRLTEVRTDLRAAEDRLQAFIQQNRDFNRSAALTFHYNRLNRDVSLQAGLFTTLSQAYETAKIDEVRDTPLIAVVAEPDVPVRPNPRGRVRILSMAIFLALGVGIVLAFAVDRLKNPQTRAQPDVQELASLAAGIRSDLRRGRVIRALFGNGVKSP